MKKKVIYTYVPSILALLFLILLVVSWSSGKVESEKLKAQLDVCDDIIVKSNEVVEGKDDVISQLQDSLSNTELDIYRLEKEIKRVNKGERDAEQTLLIVDEYINKSIELAGLFQETENWKYAFQTMYVWDMIIEKELEIIHDPYLYNETVIEKHTALKTKIEGHNEFLRNVTTDLFCTPFSTLYPNIDDSKKIVDIS
ncbi:hypothetical protein HN419_06630 [Candidatus Woesearchaeota archaeon]|jgi:hypothetical protein|nr:hypothetical protein [Candidatus Woesearchaeota archaeon]MBT3538171.1 hypothetical protein [Candidatus Woesearchaeota archaeon]MBT4697470.1 hypothetical protein [Candidatus Woesearchaeota archaeon]MBT4716886.1 hypothetical protein [Candidatus Woesearchaeota archaeon]MBT7105840.1 hypothetical protein [Candidatus Woesearchaeota archaeon]